MQDALRHRGPDDGGQWVAADGSVALGFRRLAIQDLSDAGHQPMVHKATGLVLAFNGEVYNFRQLRQELESAGVRFRSSGDTEVLLELIARRGVSETCAIVDGMFALAVWDPRRRQLTMARDRFGEKPLLVGSTGRGVVFGSELHALLQFPGLSDRLDVTALHDYFSFGYVPVSRSIYRDVRKVEPGTVEVHDVDRGTCRVQSYWQPPERGSIDLGPQEALVELESALRTSVEDRLVADRDVGMFLSGGIDSSLVVALAQEVSPRPVKTYSIGFEDPTLDESHFAATVAAHLGTDHTEMRVTAVEAQAVVPDLVDVYDEPFADSSQIPTTLLSRLTSDHVTVALSGDAGDELFLGYDRYAYLERLSRPVALLPPSARRLASRLLLSTDARAWDERSARARASAGVVARVPARLGTRMHKAARLLGDGGPGELYRGLVTHWHDGVPLDQAATGPLVSVGRLDRDLRAAAADVDLRTYLPGDILTKVDRASMSASLEVRVPLLATTVVDLALSVDPSLHRSRGRGKALLRGMLSSRVPAEAWDRPKMGFGVPLADWLRGPLRPWGHEVMSVLAASPGPVSVDRASRAWEDLLTGRSNRAAEAWTVLQLGAWMAKRPWS